MPSGGTTTIGAPLNMVARECAKPEYWVPAMGWQPTKCQPRPWAISPHFSQMMRLTPTVSMTMAPSAMRSAFCASQSMADCG